MKEGYIVWNESNYGSEFFGVYRTWEKAFAQFRRVVRDRYGKCPRGTYRDIIDWLIDNEIESGDDSYKITEFREFDKHIERVLEGLIKDDLKRIVDSLPTYCRLSGSRALGRENDDSDWDFYVPENKWTEFKKWASENISPNYTSVCTGQIAYYINKLEHNCLIEFSYLFPNVDKNVIKNNSLGDTND